MSSGMLPGESFVADSTASTFQDVLGRSDQPLWASALCAFFVHHPQHNYPFSMSR